MSFNKKIKLFASCIPVRGANISIICDLQRHTYNYIPNDIIDILDKHDGKTITNIKEAYNNKYDEIIEEYFDFLLSKEYVFLTDFPELFPAMSLEWLEPFQINNAIIDFEDNFDFENILNQLNELKCKYLEIRFFKPVDLDIITKIIEYLDLKKSIIFSVGFVMPSSNNTTIDILQKFIANFSRIAYFIIGNNPENKFIEPINDKFGYIYYATDNVTNVKNCGIVSSKFVVNTKLFTESQNHNTCLNRKISIDKNGDIKNCPSMPQNFGNIKDTSLVDALNHPDFKKYWNVNKDMIAVCKDCEFRHICTDCRAYTERTTFEGDIDLSKPLKCGYNPYTNVWEEWSTNPLKQKAIEFYGMQDLVKKDV